MQVISGGPPEYSSIEILAWECELDPDELRDYLRDAIERAQSVPKPPGTNPRNHAAPITETA